MPALKSFSGLRLKDHWDCSKIVDGSFCPGRGPGMTLKVDSPWIITEQNRTPTISNMPFIGLTKDDLQLILPTKKLSLMPFRPSGSSLTSAPEFPAFPKPRNVLIGVPSYSTPADDTALIASFGSLSNSLYQQYGPLHLNEVELYLGRTATASHYTSAMQALPNRDTLLITSSLDQ